MENICLTGATGVLGQTLLRIRPPSENRKWHIIVRARSRDAFKKRTERISQRLGLETAHVCFYHGDVSKPGLALSEGDRQDLVEGCDFFIHAAGDVRLNLTIEQARDTAVMSARSIIELFDEAQKKGQAKKLLFVSTVGAAGRMSGQIPETRFDGDLGFHNTYEHAKFTAETVVYEAMDGGLPVEILRPSMIVGDHVTGEVSSYQIFYYLANFLAGLDTDGILPQVGDLKLDIIPNRVVAEFIYERLGRPADSFPGIAHMASGPDRSPPVSDLIDRVRKVYRDFGISVPNLQFIPLSEFRDRLPEISMRRPENREFLIGLHYILPYFVDNQRFQNDGFVAALNQMGKTLPSYTDYLPQILQPFLHDRYQRMRKSA